MAATRTICEVNMMGDNSIVITPTKEEQERLDNLHTQEKVGMAARAAANHPKRRSRRARVYLWDEGNLSIFFDQKGEPTQERTLFKMEEFNCCKIFHSKYRINMHFSFSKKDWVAAREMMRKEQGKWFKAVEEHLSPALSLKGERENELV